MSAPILKPDHTEPRLLTNARLALDVARTIAQWDLGSFYLVEATEHEVYAQTSDEREARALARALCRPNQDPDVNDHHDTEGGRHLWLTVGDVRVICHQPAKEAAA